MESLRKRKIHLFILIQCLNFIFSLNNVLVKLASEVWTIKGFLSYDFMLIVAGNIILLVVYAFFWQIILKYVDLSLAYLCKATVIFWGMVWSVLFFNENITWNNIVGVIIIFIGMVMVNQDE